MTRSEEKEAIKQLVIERLKAISSDKEISIGDRGSFSIGELIDGVEKDDDIGRQAIEIQMEFLRSLKTGKLLDE